MLHEPVPGAGFWHKLVSDTIY